MHSVGSAVTHSPAPSGRRRVGRLLAAAACALPLALGACSETTQHGYVVSDLALSQIQVGSSRSM